MLFSTDYQKPDPKAVESACAAIEAGRLVVAPSETRYGILADPQQVEAVKKLLEVKRRYRSKGISIFVPDEAYLHRLAVISREAALLSRTFLPGPLTIVAPARTDWPEPIVVNGKIGLRMSPSPTILKIVQFLGRPVTATSANISGADDMTAIDRIATQLGDAVEVYIDCGPLSGPVSTVVDCSVSPPEILREGAIAPEEIAAATAKA